MLGGKRVRGYDMLGGKRVRGYDMLGGEGRVRIGGNGGLGVTAFYHTLGACQEGKGGRGVGGNGFLSHIAFMGSGGQGGNFAADGALRRGR